jgi:DNA invertase Pin-like site-specific DNA recombinase
MSFVVGYARVSTESQHEENQCDELLKVVPKDQIFVDKGVSGKVPAKDRPGFRKLLSFLELNEVESLYVYEISRIGRNYSDAIRTILDLEEKGITVISLSPKEQFLNSCGNKLVKQTMLSFMVSIAEMEREHISERTKQGLKRTKDQGTRLGQPVKPIDMIEVELMRQNGMTTQQIAEHFGVSRATLSRRINNHIIE